MHTLTQTWMRTDDNDGNARAGRRAWAKARMLVWSFACPWFLCGLDAPANAAAVFVDNVSLSSGWSDANKDYVDDTQLCWAAATANLLAYTGWIGTPNLSSADPIFNDYKKYWNDVGGHAVFGVDWWFDGVNQRQGVSGWAQLTDTTHPGFYTTALYDSKFHFYELSGDLEKIILDSVTGHRGVTLGIGWMNGEIRDGGHAVTIWGIDTAADYLYITDSDDRVTALQRYAYDPATRYLTGYASNAYLENISALDLWQAGSDPNPTPRPVPEPSAVLLLVAGLVGLCQTRKRH